MAGTVNSPPQYYDNFHIPVPNVPGVPSANLAGNPSITCFSCGGVGHRKSACLWAGNMDSQPDTLCQICGQLGHPAGDCSSYVTTCQQGNWRGPGDPRRGRPAAGKQPRQ